MGAEFDKVFLCFIQERWSILKALSHFKTITKHKRLVMRGCFKMGLYWQGIMHDMSKYSPWEFIVGCKYFTGDKSPNDGERRDKGYSSAWLHHKGRNKHHFEYWMDYSYPMDSEHPIAGMRMPVKYVAEMFADRVAACKVYQKDAYTCRSPLEYYERGRARMIIHEETDELLHSMLKMLAEEGEEKTFRYIRKEILKK
jgi:hypothetical protein